MATISAKDVAALRAKTGIGMMECKKALVEAEGDVEAAIKILREKGELKAESKMATRAKRRTVSFSPILKIISLTFSSTVISASNLQAIKASTLAGF